MSGYAQSVVIRSLGLTEYEPVWQAMKLFTNERDANSADEIWCLQHFPVYTQGQAGKAEHILNAGNIPVIPIDRGGQVTYHGPGQLIVYTLIDLARKKIGVREFVTLIENIIINTLADFGVRAASQLKAPGVYVDDVKIASIGLRVRKGCSFHGLSLNVDMDLQPFAGINPCGYAGLAVTDIKRLGGSATVEQVQNKLVSHLADALGYTTLTYENTLRD